MSEEVQRDSLDGTPDGGAGIRLENGENISQILIVSQFASSSDELELLVFVAGRGDVAEDGGQSFGMAFVSENNREINSEVIGLGLL